MDEVKFKDKIRFKKGDEVIDISSGNHGFLTVDIPMGYLGSTIIGCESSDDNEYGWVTDVCNLRLKETESQKLIKEWME